MRGIKRVGIRIHSMALRSHLVAQIFGPRVDYSISGALRLHSHYTVILIG